MGRVTVFSLDGCHHCKRVTSELDKVSIPYQVISLSSHPLRRNDMIGMTDRVTVPQVFFNDLHIGGADETIEQLKQWDLERYKKEIESQPDPTDHRLRESSVDDPINVLEEEEAEANEARRRRNVIVVPTRGGKECENNKKTVSILEVTETLKRILPRNDFRKKAFKVYKNTFTGKQAIDEIMKHYSLPSEDVAKEYCLLLKQKQIIIPVSGSGNEKEGVEKAETTTAPLLSCEQVFSPTTVYRLQCLDTPTILNSYRIWTDDVHPHHITALMKRLKRLLNNVVRAMSNEIGEVDYKNAHLNEHYAIFEEAICELQRVQLSDVMNMKSDDSTEVGDYSDSSENGTMTNKSMLAFGINLYNLMIKFAFMKVGIGCCPAARCSFFNNIRFNIGGHLFSFQDWEHGILRGNKRAPYSLFRQINEKGSSDPRKDFIIPVDERIHFALNCGAKSCPSIHTFTPECIDDELRIATYAFLEDDDNLDIQTEKRTIYLSKILKWYSQDFVVDGTKKSSKVKLIEKLMELLRDTNSTRLQTTAECNNTNTATTGSWRTAKSARLQKLEQLEELLEEAKKKKIKISYKDYDWSTPNASQYACFNKKSVKN